MAKQSKPEPRRWRIFIARKKAVYIGMVEATDAESAVEAGAKEFGYPAWRLIAEPLESSATGSRAQGARCIQAAQISANGPKRPG